MRSKETSLPSQQGRVDQLIMHMLFISALVVKTGLQVSIQNMLCLITYFKPRRRLHIVIYAEDFSLFKALFFSFPENLKHA